MNSHASAASRSPHIGPGSTGMTPLLTNLAVGGGSPPSMTLDGPSPGYHGNPPSSMAAPSYHTSFRSGQDDAQPPTGLGILMSSHNGGSMANGGTHTLHHQHHSLSTPQQQNVMKQDAQDRDRQARALAAAGMKAQQLHDQVVPLPKSNSNIALHPPPTLGNPTSGIAHPGVNGAAGGILVTSANPGGTVTTATSNTGEPCMSWNNLEMNNNPGEPVLTLEEMEMDFAKMFDPNVEWENMQTEGSGWPQMMEQNAAAMGSGAVAGDEAGAAPAPLGSEDYVARKT